MVGDRGDIISPAVIAYNSDGSCNLAGSQQWLGCPPRWQFLFGKIGTLSNNSRAQRQELWVQGLALVRQYQLFGIGLGALTHIAPYAAAYSFGQPGPVQTHAHNMFLKIALARRAAWRAYTAGIERPLVTALLSAFVVVIVHGMGETIM